MKRIQITEISPEELAQLIHKHLEAIRPLIREELQNILATPKEDRLVTRKEAMNILGIKSRDTMIKLERAGDLDPIKTGGTNRVSYRFDQVQILMQNR